MRVSKQQRKFLKAVEAANRPVEIEICEPPRSLPYYVNYDFAWDWGFRSEGAAQRWLENLVERGLITLEKQRFARISDAGRAAISTATTSSTGKIMRRENRPTAPRRYKKPCPGLPKGERCPLCGGSYTCQQPDRPKKSTPDN